MMRRRWRSQVLLVTCGSLLLGGACASATGTLARANAGPARAAGRPRVRSWNLTLAPAPDDLALAEISFPRYSRHTAISAASLRLAVSGPFGDDYLAAAAPLAGSPTGPRALVVLVNRPSPLLDPAAVRLRVTTWRLLGKAVVRSVSDPFTHPVAGVTPALCDLSPRGAALSASELRPLLARGAALSGVGAAGAVAQAYDVACGLPYTSAFAQDITHGGVSTQPPLPPPSPEPPAPAPQPAPTPEQPREGTIPGEQCRREDRPGVACPLVAAARAVR
jgi:hypothetical protein